MTVWLNLKGLKPQDISLNTLYSVAKNKDPTLKKDENGPADRGQFSPKHPDATILKVFLKVENKLLDRSIHGCITKS